MVEAVAAQRLLHDRNVCSTLVSKCLLTMSCLRNLDFRKVPGLVQRSIGCDGQLGNLHVRLRFPRTGHPLSLLDILPMSSFDVAIPLGKHAAHARGAAWARASILHPWYCPVYHPRLLELFN